MAVLDPLVRTRRAKTSDFRKSKRTGMDEAFWNELELIAPGSAFLPSLPEPTEEELLASELTDTEASLLSLLSPTPIAIDELVRQSGLSARLVHMQLLELEMAGRLERHGGSAVSLRP